MDKNKALKIVVTVTFIILAGILYSCSFSPNKPRVESLNQKDNTSQNDLNNSQNILDNNQKSMDGTQQSMDSENQSMDSNQQTMDRNQQTMDNSQKTSENSSNNDDNKKILYIHICGAVNKPDVYEVKDGTRIVDAIHLAGGLTDNAAGDYINQAALVTDGQQIYIPTKAEVKGKKPEEYTPGDTDKTPGKVNINTANMDQLMTLTGIGESKAKSIIAYRQDNGGFKTIDEIKNIDGIKDSVFNKISDSITVD